MTIKIVPCDQSHEKLIWAWRNDPITRKMSRNSDEISWDEHQKWFQASLAGNERKLHIGVMDKVPFGMIRYDIMGAGQFVFNINLNPAFRGRKLSDLFMEKSIEFLKAQGTVKHIFAETRIDNHPMNAVFQKRNWQLYAVEDGFNKYRLTVAE